MKRSVDISCPARRDRCLSRFDIRRASDLDEAAGGEDVVGVRAGKRAA
jgi:hypothetical protein